MKDHRAAPGMRCCCPRRALGSQRGGGWNSLNQAQVGEPPPKLGLWTWSPFPFLQTLAAGETEVWPLGSSSPFSALEGVMLMSSSEAGSRSWHRAHRHPPPPALASGPQRLPLLPLLLRRALTATLCRWGPGLWEAGAVGLPPPWCPRAGPPPGSFPQCPQDGGSSALPADLVARCHAEKAYPESEDRN